MSFELLSSGSSVSSLRTACDPFDFPPNNVNGMNSYSNNNTSFGGNGNGAGSTLPFKPLGMTSFTPTPRPHLSMTEQAELEFELRYRGNMIVDQQRKIQQLEEELKRARDQMDIMSSQIAAYEQDRLKDRKKPQSRYWTPDEHQRFLEALNKFGHKDVKAISQHVSTRNATQVRTHAQKYFLRLERERRKKGGEDDGMIKDEGYGSSGDEFSDNSMSPTEEFSPQQHISGISTPPPLAPLAPITAPAVPPAVAALQSQPRRRRAVSLITPTLGKSASNHRDAVLAEMPGLTPEDYDQFVKGLLSIVDKQEDITQVSRVIRDGYVPHLSEEDVETCYKLVHKFLKQKPAVAPSAIPSSLTSSPKRRRTSKPELPLNIPLLNISNNNSNNNNNTTTSGATSTTSDGPLPAMGSMSLSNNNNNNTHSSSFASFMASGMPTLSGGYGGNMGGSGGSSSPLPPSSLTYPPTSMGSPLINMNMGMRPIMDAYGGMPSMAPLQMHNSNNMGLNSMMGMMDISSVGGGGGSGGGLGGAGGGWGYAFDLHPSTPTSGLTLPQGAPLVSSLN